MIPAHRRHDISDAFWEILKPHLPGREGVRGVLQRIIVSLSTQFFGFCAQFHRGETDHTPLAISDLTLYPGGRGFFQ